MTKPVLELSAVRLDLAGMRVLDGVNLVVAPGEVVALAGPSGSGKTTLLRVALGLTMATTGSVRLRGQEASRDGRCLVPPEERQLAVVFQDLALWPHLSVHGNLAFALDARGVEPRERDRRIEQSLVGVGLAGLDARLPATLSGGERQRVAIARALVTEPDLVFFDEPLASLDVALRDELLALLPVLLAERGAAAVYTTHDPREVEALATRVVVLERGRVIQTGSLREIAAAPASAFARAFTRGVAR